MSELLKVYQIEGSKSSDSVIMLHGYGANGRDLVGITGMPEISDLELNWYFLEAPLEPSELMAFGGKAWFSLTLSSFNPNMNADALEKFYSMKNPEFEKSMEMVKNTIWDLDLKTDVHIGGFSQGAMMATNIFMDDPKGFKSLIALSGAPLNHTVWPKKGLSKKAFVSHGEQDPVLPFKCGAQLNEKLSESGLDVETIWFQGGHEIPHSTLTKLSEFLSA